MILTGIILTVIMGVILAVGLWKSKDTDDKFGAMVVGLAWFVLVIVGYTFYAEDRYKQGQVDALIGKIEYELVTQPDSTRVWKEIKNERR